MCDQLKQEELGAIFNMVPHDIRSPEISWNPRMFILCMCIQLALDECVLPEYPAKYERINPRIAPESRSRDRKGGKKSSKRSTKRRVRKDAARAVLNEMLGRLGGGKGDSVSADDVHAFLAEVCR